jgi:hypothetical protein
MSTKNRSASRFVFRGTAAALSARLREIGGVKTFEVMDGPPASALTVVGGKSTSEGGSGTYRDFLSWKATKTSSIGEQISANAYRTTTHAAAYGVVATNKPFVFTAGDLEATMQADHKDGYESSFQLTHVSFGPQEELALEGKPITLEYNNWAEKLKTYSSFVKAFQEKKSFFESQRACLGKRGEKLKFGKKPLRLASGYVYSSIVKAVQWNGVTYPGNSLTLRGFGTIYFGELLVSETNRRLTMARLEMGCDLEAEVGLTEVDPNGIWG